MNIRNLKVLAAVVAVLITVLLILEQGRNPGAVNPRLLPELKSRINDVTTLAIRSSAETITVEKSADSWVVRERGNYAADIGKLRQLLLALADARVVEGKTSDPAKYTLLGVNDPADADSQSIEISITGDDFEQVLVLGKTAQSNYRYARAGSEARSVLIDKNPDVPVDAIGWLAQAILDIGADRMQRITIAHKDGEEIQIQKESLESKDFQVMNIPEGRELSYPGVANGIGAALGNLAFSDVRAAPENEMPADVLTTFQTFDGLTIEMAMTLEEETSWFSVSVASGAENDDSGVGDEAASINERVSGWQYAITDYKAKLLKRRFEDILKASNPE